MNDFYECVSCGARFDLVESALSHKASRPEHMLVYCFGDKQRVAFGEPAELPPRIPDLTTFEKLLEKKLSSLSWALNKMTQLTAAIAEAELPYIMVNVKTNMPRKHVLRTNLNVFFTKADAVKDRRTLSRLLRLLECRKLVKTQTSQGFTKLIGYCEGVKVSVFTHWCFEAEHVKVVEKSKRTQAITTCTNRKEAEELAKKKGYIIEP